jgi:hypothetical protein
MVGIGIAEDFNSIRFKTALKHNAALNYNESTNLVYV